MVIIRLNIIVLVILTARCDHYIIFKNKVEELQVTVTVIVIVIF